MGAYQNPPLIQMPNYGEIVARNVQNIMAIVNQRKEKQEGLVKERENKFLKAGEQKTAFAKKAQNIKAGALTENVNDIAFSLVDKNSINEDLFAKGEITAEEYSNNKSQYEMVLNGLSGTGAAVREFSENIKDLDLSSYQENAPIIGLIEAYKNGAVDAEIIDGQVELHYMAGDQKIVVDQSMLNDPNTWSVVEKFDSDEITTELAKVVEQQINNQVTNEYSTENGVVLTTEERYSQAYGTKEQRIDQIMQNKVVSGLDRQELGSYYMDRVSADIDAKSDEDLNAVLDAYGLSEEQKSQVKSDVSQGVWSSRDFKNNDKKPVNSGDILREVAKRKLAKEVLDKVRPPKVKTQISTIKKTADAKGVSVNQQIADVVNSGEADVEIKKNYELMYDEVEYAGNYLVARSFNKETEEMEEQIRIDVTNPLDMALALSRMYQTDKEYDLSKRYFSQQGVFQNFSVPGGQDASKKAMNAGLKLK